MTWAVSMVRLALAYRPAIRDAASFCDDEITGMAEGSGTSLAEAWQFQLRAEAGMVLQVTKPDNGSEPKSTPAEPIEPDPAPTDPDDGPVPDPTDPEDSQDGTSTDPTGDDGDSTANEIVGDPYRGWSMLSIPGSRDEGNLASALGYVHVRRFTKRDQSITIEKAHALRAS